MTKRRTDNTMTKRRRADNTMTKRRTDNTMTKRRRADNTMTKRKKTNKQHDFLPSFIRELFYHFNSFKISF
jgi:hypothetical protein